MAQRESKRSHAIMEHLRKRGWFCWKTHGNEFTMSGLPDVNCIAEGYYFGLETKNPEDRDDVSEIQKLRHEQIRMAGGVAEVVCGAKEAERVVDASIAIARSTGTLGSPRKHG